MKGFTGWKERARVDVIESISIAVASCIVVLDLLLMLWSAAENEPLDMMLRTGRLPWRYATILEPLIAIFVLPTNDAKVIFVALSPKHNHSFRIGPAGDLCETSCPLFCHQMTCGSRFYIQHTYISLLTPSASVFPDRSRKPRASTRELPDDILYMTLALHQPLYSKHSPR